MAKAAGKRFNNWYQLDSTQELLEALESDTGIPVSQLIEVKKGNSKKFEQGTWGHPHVALDFAQWCNVRLKIQCLKWLDELLTIGKVELAPAPEFPHILKTPRPWEKRFTKEFCNKVFKWQGGYFFHIWIYDDLTPEEREYVNSVNPTRKGRRKMRIHQYLNEEAAKVLEKKLTPIFVIADIANSYDEFQNLHNRLGGNFQLDLPGVLG